MNGDLFCTVLMLEKSRYGNTFEEIEHKLPDEIKVLKKVFSVPYSNIGKYIKRVDALLFTKIGNSISSMKIEDLR